MAEVGRAETGIGPDKTEMVPVVAGTGLDRTETAPVGVDTARSGTEIALAKAAVEALASTAAFA